MDMNETRVNSSFPLNTPWPWISAYEVLSESNLAIPKSAVDCGQHRFLPSGIIHDRQLSGDSVEKTGHGFLRKKYALEIEIFTLSRGFPWLRFRFAARKKEFSKVSMRAVWKNRHFQQNRPKAIIQAYQHF